MEEHAYRNMKHFEKIDEQIGTYDDGPTVLKRLAALEYLCECQQAELEAIKSHPSLSMPMLVIYLPAKPDEDEDEDEDEDKEDCRQPHGEYSDADLLL